MYELSRVEPYSLNRWPELVPTIEPISFLGRSLFLIGCAGLGASMVSTRYLVISDGWNVPTEILVHLF